MPAKWRPDIQEAAMHDLLIIGGGPAGLAAAAYGLGKQRDVRLICAGFGGQAGQRQQLIGQSKREQLVGEEAFVALQETFAAHPSCIVDDQVIGVSKRDELFHVLTERTTLHAPAVIIATGAHPTRLGIADEQQLLGHGLGYSITTHAHLAAGREVAVVGTTERALRGVAELVQIAARIVLIAPTPGALSSQLGQRLRADPRVHILEGFAIVDVEASSGAVYAIRVARQATTQRLPVQAVFVDLGLVPNSHLVRQLVRLDEHGFIIIDDHNQTSLPGMFAAGDVTNRVCEQILIAIGEGARAAQSAYDYTLVQRLGLDSRASGAR
jgi:thioredoxin reductase (NADPH)/alkyl hydroperoxide reductase subunit F